MIMKKLEDYLPLYLGCELFTGTGTVTLFAVTKEIIPVTTFKVAVINGNQTYSTDLGNMLPILRPFQSMTKEEQKLWESKCEIVKVNGFVNDTPESFRYLLSIGIDLFGLIEAGLAVDAAFIKSIHATPQYPSKDNGYNRGLWKGSYEFRKEV